ncbi:hypothetical protein Ari01nite_99100 [Paractinoplanes rishiriensis]|uniref:Uncharacterized protein n=1 Tax=Paractinoplanes rishiriensis TaxID=1050105 RepID=A0A919KBH2_9ACTN|nr:hypothetical protein Ari01nite_99100 [Actinoplanes rishiriensis]
MSVQAAAELGNPSRRIPADAVYNGLRLGQVPARRGPNGRWCIPVESGRPEIYQQRIAGSVGLKEATDPTAASHHQALPDCRR